MMPFDLIAGADLDSDSLGLPSPWERTEVTICIAAVANPFTGPRAIITCSDWRISEPGVGTADTAHKQESLIGTLNVELFGLVAGSKPGADALVRTLQRRFYNEDNIDETNIRPLVLGALNQRKKELNDEYTIGKFGLPFDEFLAIGKDKLPEDIFHSATLNISRINLAASMIIAGFVEHNDVILETTQDCKVKWRDQYAAIGEGRDLAAASLAYRKFSTVEDLPRALYCVYEAKKAAERIASVGPSTLIQVLFEDGTRKSFRLEKMNEFYGSLLKEYGPKPLPMHMDLPDELFW